MIRDAIIHGAIGAGVVILAFIVFRIKMVFRVGTQILDDTCKDSKNGKWSMPKLMMIFSFNAFIVAFFYDLYKQGHINEWAAIALLTVAVTGKIADAKSKQIDPTVPPQPPKEEGA